MATQVSAYDRKVQIILDANLSRYKGQHTPEEYELELTVARNILAQLGVHP